MKHLLVVDLYRFPDWFIKETYFSNGDLKFKLRFENILFFLPVAHPTEKKIKLLNYFFFCCLPPSTCVCQQPKWIKEVFHVDIQQLLTLKWNLRSPHCSWLADRKTGMACWGAKRKCEAKCSEIKRECSS